MIFAGLVREYAIPSLSNFNSCDASQLNVRNGAVAMSVLGMKEAWAVSGVNQESTKIRCAATCCRDINHKIRMTKKFFLSVRTFLEGNVAPVVVPGNPQQGFANRWSQSAIETLRA